MTYNNKSVKKWMHICCMSENIKKTQSKATYALTVGFSYKYVFVISH